MKNRQAQHLTRRGFLASSVAIAAAASAGARVSNVDTHLRIGLLGPGRHGTDLLREMGTLGAEYDAEVVAIHRDSLDTLLCSGLDAVIIATPDHLHAETAIAAMNAGLHVYCAAPMALAATDAAAVRDAARDSDRIYHVEIELVCEPRWRAARRIVRSGMIGDVRWCSGTTHEGAAGFEDGWRTDLRCSHGPAAHHLHELWAACAYATGVQEIIKISAMGGGYQSGPALPDALSLSADFERGVHFSLDCRPAPQTVPHAVIRGGAGSLIICHECIVFMPEAPRDAPLDEVWRDEGETRVSPLSNWLAAIRRGASRDGNAELAYSAASGIARAVDAYRQHAVA